MANTDWAFGFQPWGKVLSKNIYAVTTAPSINIHPGDIVGISGTYDLTPHHGYLQSIYDADTIDGQDNLLGVVLACFDEKYDPVSYIALSEAGNGTIAGYVLVADDPHQLYVGREDFDTNAIDVTEAAYNCDIVSPANNVGNTTTGRSKQMIDSTSAAVTATLNIKLLFPHPDDVNLVADDTPGASADEGARWIFQINEHYLNQSQAIEGGVSA